MVEAGVSMEMIAQYLSHDDVETTRRHDSNDARSAGINGGGRSHMRTRLYCQIPC